MPGTQTNNRHPTNSKPLADKSPESVHGRAKLMDLSIIIVNWNSADFVLECIASIQESTSEIAYEIIVVDNASLKEDIEKLKHHFPQITIIEQGENLGFARANNLGFSYSSGKYVLFLNPDTRIMGAAINTLLREIKASPGAGVVGGKLLNTDLSVQLSSIQRFPTILNQVLDAKYLQLRWPHCPLWDISPLFSDEVKRTEVEVVSGACMLLSREVFKQVGTFSEDYFMYAEDVDLSYKVQHAGFTNYYIGEAVIIHHGGKSSSRQEVGYWATTMRYRAMRQLFQKTRGSSYVAVYRAAMGCAALVRLTLLALESSLRRTPDRKSLQFATEKWKVVLKWAIGW